MDTYWVPGVNNLRAYGRWAFAEMTDVYLIESELNELIDGFAGQSASGG
jgi:type III restriction enzyme